MQAGKIRVLRLLPCSSRFGFAIISRHFRTRVSWGFLLGIYGFLSRVSMRCWRSLSRDEAIPRDTRRAAKLLIYLFIYFTTFVSRLEKYSCLHRIESWNERHQCGSWWLSTTLCSPTIASTEFVVFIDIVFNLRFIVNNYCCRLWADDASKRERTAIVGNRMNFWLKQWMKRGNGKQNSRCRSWNKFLFSVDGDFKISNRFDLKRIRDWSGWKRK